LGNFKAFKKDMLNVNQAIARAMSTSIFASRKFFAFLAIIIQRVILKHNSVHNHCDCSKILMELEIVLLLIAKVKANSYPELK
jgi:hypothetical protein